MIAPTPALWAAAAATGAASPLAFYDPELQRLETRDAYLTGEVARQQDLRAALEREGDPDAALKAAEAARAAAEQALAEARRALEGQQARKGELQAERDAAGSALAAAKADIVLNPRYGTFDAKTVQFAKSAPNWLKPQPAASGG